MSLPTLSLSLTLCGVVCSCMIIGATGATLQLHVSGLRRWQISSASCCGPVSVVSLYLGPCSVPHSSKKDSWQCLFVVFLSAVRRHNALPAAPLLVRVTHSNDHITHILYITVAHTQKKSHLCSRHDESFCNCHSNSLVLYKVQL